MDDSAAAAAAIGASVTLHVCARVCVCCEYNARCSIIHGLWFFLNKIRFLSMFCFDIGLMFLFYGSFFFVYIKNTDRWFGCVLAIFSDIDEFSLLIIIMHGNQVSANGHTLNKTKRYVKMQGPNSHFLEWFVEKRKKKRNENQPKALAFCCRKYCRCNRLMRLCVWVCANATACFFSSCLHVSCNIIASTWKYICSSSCSTLYTILSTFSIYNFNIAHYSRRCGSSSFD